ncbi:MAG: hypothetical protein WAO91_05880 [Candidatus Nitrosotenuis sp.]
MQSVMKKGHTILLLGGAMVAAGMVISYFGSTLATQDLAVLEGRPADGSSIEITKDLDPARTAVGAFVIRAESFEGGTLRATVYDPSGAPIASKTIDGVSTEEQFEISTKGMYKLVLENSGSEASVIIGLTHMPEKSVLALNVLGQGIIVSGFVGLGIAVVYLIKDRKKSV